MAGIILACIGLSKIAWKVEHGTYNSFGVVQVHLDDDTHRLETMGLVWPAYTSSRCALGFTIIGLIFSLRALYKTYDFCSNSQRSIGHILTWSFFCSTWYFWAILLYGTIFPRQPFKGDLFLGAIGANFTTWENHPNGGFQLQSAEAAAAPEAEYQMWQHDIAMARSPLISPHSVESLLTHPPDRHLSPAPYQQTMFDHDDHIPHDPFAAYDRLSSFSSSIDPLDLFPPLSSRRASSSVFHSLADVPSFPSPTPIPTLTTESADSLATRYFYARMAWKHLNTKWKFGTGYWLVLSAALATIWWPFAYCVYLIYIWLLEGHRARVVQQKLVVIPLVVLMIAVLVGIIALSSRSWKVGDDPDADGRFGLDRIIIMGKKVKLKQFRFSEKERRIKDASATALAFGILGTFAGVACIVTLVPHIYDSTREWIKVGLLSTITAGCWLIGVSVYGAIFPQYIGSTYFSLGYSYWLGVATGIIWFIPIFTFVWWRIIARARRTTRDERLMAIPTACAFLAIVFTVGALSSTNWCASSYGATVRDNHLGLLKGRYMGEWVHFTEIAAISLNLSSVGVATLILLLCGMAIQTPTFIIGMIFVSGRHAVCKKQVALLNTAFAVSTFILQVCAVILYGVLVPWSDLVAGFELSHSWRLQLVAAVATFASCIGFGALAKPPLPGEPNLLAEAIG